MFLVIIQSRKNSTLTLSRSNIRSRSLNVHILLYIFYISSDYDSINSLPEILQKKAETSNFAGVSFNFYPMGKQAHASPICTPHWEIRDR